jgi:predicted 3-demethylubiquinone-9 3-methyltransferase (glyoxalase superfamily)
VTLQRAGRAARADARRESACGWRQDKWARSWQITPRARSAAITDTDCTAAQHAFDAMMQVTKIDID